MIHAEIVRGDQACETATLSCLFSLELLVRAKMLGPGIIMSVADRGGWRVSNRREGKVSTEPCRVFCIDAVHGGISTRFLPRGGEGSLVTFI